MPSGERIKERIERELREQYKEMRGEPTMTNAQARDEIVSVAREMADGLMTTVAEEDKRVLGPVARADYALLRAASMDLIKHLRSFK